MKTEFYFIQCSINISDATHINFLCTWRDTAIKNSVKSCLHLFLKYWMEMLPLSLEYREGLSLPSEDYWSCLFKISRIAICYYYTLKLSGHLARQEQSLSIVGFAWKRREGLRLSRASWVSLEGRCLSRAERSKPTFAGFGFKYPD